MTPSPCFLAASILSAPGWTRVGITAPRESLREQAAAEMARHIATLIEDEADAVDDRQIVLPL